MTLREKIKLINEIMKVNDFTHERKLDFVKEMKKEVRKALKKERNSSISRHFSEDGESCYIKEWYNSPFTDQEKYEYMENEWIRIYSPYDCTGKWFTQSIRICNLKEPNSFGARSVVYHFMGLDV